MMKLTENEYLVLNQLDEDYCYYFDTMAQSTGLDRKDVRNACHSLRAKGLATFVRGLSNEEDFLVRGSGYALTREGDKERKLQRADRALRDAAPELLDALKCCVAYIQELGHDPYRTGATDAIAKAEGRA